MIYSVEDDTIAAIATAVSPGGIGIIRISGREAVSVTEKIFRPKRKGFLLSEAKTHTLHYGTICSGGEVYDEVLVSVMRAPKTYTREDVVEINCHGGVFVMKKILNLVLEQGARLAEPGEFTKRAFFNGRIDLSQAEAVMDVVGAENEYALKNGVGQLGGSLSRKIKNLRDSLIYETAFIESALDDPEHISLEGYREKLEVKLEDILKNIRALIQGADNGKIMKEGIFTAIVGKPNVGKSSLLNAMMGEERAIVTEIAGTTRDTLEETVSFYGITLHLIDTAGIRDASDQIEKMGVDRAKESIKRAQLVLFVADGAKTLTPEDDEILSLVKEKKVIFLWNKSDLKDYDPEIPEKIQEKCKCPCVRISAKNGEGMENLSEIIQNMFYQGEISTDSQVYITNERHKRELIQAEKSLKLVMQSINNKMPEDFFSVDLMDAYEALGRILGESLEDDLAEQIFSKFCTGK